jgi:glycosyltransferase involved in cell wall biosynthesis
MEGHLKPRVAVIYHFFAHYRSAIMCELLNSKDIEYVLVADRVDPDNSIKPWQPPEDRLLVAPCIKITSTLLWQKGLVRLVLRHDIDAVIFLGNANFVSTWVAAALSRMRQKRVLFWTHGWIRDESGIKGAIRNLFYRLAHGLLLYGHKAKTIGVQNGFDEDTLYIVYNSMDLQTQRDIRAQVTHSRLKHIRKECFPGSNAPVLICTGRLTKSKDLGLLLKAMALLQAQGFETCLLLVGEGPERAPLAQMANDLRLTVHFYGACYDEKLLAELIMSANLTVSPGQVGLTAMHSLAYGTPVITHDDPAHQMPEWEAIIPGKTGDLFKRGDALDLAATIRKWCVNPWPDDDVRSQCMAVIEQHYNPQFQQQVINRAVAGLPAD